MTDDLEEYLDHNSLDVLHIIGHSSLITSRLLKETKPAISTSWHIGLRS